jgi:uncharacterized protein (DUF302 family)
MTTTKQALGMYAFIHTDFDTAEAQVRSALMAEGFGVLTEIDVKATFKKKLDADFRPYKILGACNPSLAYRALNAVPDVGMLLPCNVTVSQEDDDRILVSIIDPEMMLGVIDDPTLADVACDAKERLQRVVDSLAA